MVKKLFLIMMFAGSPLIAMEKNFLQEKLYKLSDRSVLPPYLSDQQSEYLYYRTKISVDNWANKDKEISALSLAIVVMNAMKDCKMNVVYTGVYTKDHKRAADLIRAICPDAMQELKERGMMQEATIDHALVDVFFHTTLKLAE